MGAALRATQSKIQQTPQMKQSILLYRSKFRQGHPFGCSLLQGIQMHWQENLILILDNFFKQLLMVRRIKFAKNWILLRQKPDFCSSFVCSVLHETLLLLWMSVNNMDNSFRHIANGIFCILFLCIIFITAKKKIE